MESLSINAAEPAVISSITPPPMEERRRPGVAFALSLLYPGLGHIYCKKTQAGVITGAFFTGCILVVLLVAPSESALFWGMALRASIVLYGFAFLDAFYAAREINTGIDQYMIGNNPRIAAMLNLLTAGFGYFYLGERTKGLVWFFASRILFSMSTDGKSNVIAMIVEFACVVVAADAFRIARRKLQESFPTESTDPFATSPQGLSPLAPIALGVFLVFNYFAVVTFGLVAPKYDVSDKSQLSTTELAEGGSTIEHLKYGVGMRLPAGWKVNTTSKEFLLGGSHPEYGCQVGLMMSANAPLHGSEGIARQLEAGVRQTNPSYQWLSEGRASIGGKPAYVLTFQVKYNEIPVLEKLVFLQHGLTLYSIVEASSVGAASECGPMMDEILSTVKLNF
jgi:hypothetical protein